MGAGTTATSSRSSGGSHGPGSKRDGVEDVAKPRVAERAQLCGRFGEEAQDEREAQVRRGERAQESFDVARRERPVGRRLAGEAGFVVDGVGAAEVARKRGEVKDVVLRGDELAGERGRVGARGRGARLEVAGQRRAQPREPRLFFVAGRLSSDEQVVVLFVVVVVVLVVGRGRGGKVEIAAERRHNELGADGIAEPGRERREALRSLDALVAAVRHSEPPREERRVVAVFRRSSLLLLRRCGALEEGDDIAEVGELGEVVEERGLDASEVFCEVGAVRGDLVG